MVDRLSKVHVYHYMFQSWQGMMMESLKDHQINLFALKNTFSNFDKKS